MPLTYNVRIYKLRQILIINPPRGAVSSLRGDRRLAGLIDNVSYDASNNRSDYSSGHYVARAVMMMRRRGRRRRRGSRPRRTRCRFRRRRRVRPRTGPVYSRPAVARSMMRRGCERLRTSGQHRCGCKNGGYFSYFSPNRARHKLSPRLFPLIYIEPVVQKIYVRRVSTACQVRVCRAPA